MWMLMRRQGVKPGQARRLSPLQSPWTGTGAVDSRSYGDLLLAEEVENNIREQSGLNDDDLLEIDAIVPSILDDDAHFCPSSWDSGLARAADTGAEDNERLLNDVYGYLSLFSQNATSDELLEV